MLTELEEILGKPISEDMFKSFRNLTMDDMKEACSHLEKLFVLVSQPIEPNRNFKRCGDHGMIQFFYSFFIMEYGDKIRKKSKEMERKWNTQ